MSVSRLVSNNIMLVRPRMDYITQLPPEILTVIISNCTKWYKPRTNRGRPIPPNSDEVAITHAIMYAIASTCKYFREIVSTINFITKPSPDSFVLRNSYATQNLLKIASINFIKMLVGPKKVNSVDLCCRSNTAKGVTINFSQPWQLQIGIINHVVEEGPSDILIELRRMGLLADYVYNSLGFITQTKKSPGVCYAARYRYIDQVHDLNRHVEGVPSNVAVRVVNNWISRMWILGLLKQSDLNKALNLIIRVHPDHAHQVMNFISRMRSTKLKGNKYYSCNFTIDDNELALYSMYRGTSEYSRFLMLKLPVFHRMKILAMLPIAKNKYPETIANWDLTVCEELMILACKRVNRTLASFCKECCVNSNNEDLRSKINYIYSKQFCSSGGSCCALDRYTISQTDDISSCTTLVQNYSRPGVISEYDTSGLCYKPCPVGYNRNIVSSGSRVNTCTCNYDGRVVTSSSGNLSFGNNGISFNSFNLYSGEYQPSGSVNISRSSDFFINFAPVTDPAAQFIRGNEVRFGSSTPTFQIPRFGDLMSDMTLTLPLDGITNNYTSINTFSYLNNANIDHNNDSDIDEPSGGLGAYGLFDD